MPQYKNGGTEPVKIPFEGDLFPGDILKTEKYLNLASFPTLTKVDDLPAYNPCIYENVIASATTFAEVVLPTTFTDFKGKVQDLTQFRLVIESVGADVEVRLNSLNNTPSHTIAKNTKRQYDCPSRIIDKVYVKSTAEIIIRVERF